jgi:hypothetical protein
LPTQDRRVTKGNIIRRPFCFKRHDASCTTEGRPRALEMVTIRARPPSGGIHDDSQAGARAALPSQYRRGRLISSAWPWSRPA